MPATMIIPTQPALVSRITEFLGPVAEAPALASYRLFLKRYGGGHVFPNTLVAEAPINVQFSDPKWSVQSFRNIDKNIGKHAEGLSMGYWDDHVRPIAAISGGDELLLDVGRDIVGHIYYWSPDDDGSSYRIVKVADSFEALLAAMEFYPDQGKTPPWNRMASTHDAPAVPLKLAP